MVLHDYRTTGFVGNKPIRLSSRLQINETEFLLFGLPSAIVADEDPDGAMAVHVLYTQLLSCDTTENVSCARLVLEGGKPAAFFATYNSTVLSDLVDRVRAYTTSMSSFL